MIVDIQENTKKEVSSQEEYFKALSLIAHNAQGPIKYIHYVTQFTLDNWDKMKQEDLHSCALIMNEAAKNIDTMLANLLVWARLKEGSLKASKVQISVSDIVSSESALYSPFLKLKKIEVEFNLSANAIAVTDENIFRIIFQNVLSNAIKFAPQESKIIVGTKKQENGAVEISVTDFGKGFPADETLEGCSTDIKNLGTLNEIGSGYGLTMTRDLLKRLGGKLNIQSGGEMPTTVSIVIPSI